MAAPTTSSLSPVTLDRGVRIMGQPHAMMEFFTRLEEGKPIVLGVLGASVAQNAGCLAQHGKRCMGYRGGRGRVEGWAVRLLHHINRTWPADHQIANLALDGTGADHAARCMVSRLPRSATLTIAEWGSMAMHNAWMLPSIERVVRTLLARPRPPVVVHLNLHEWCSQRLMPRRLYRTGEVLQGHLRRWVFPDTPWAAVDDEATRIARHYGQPSLSVHAMLAPHVLGREAGFDLTDVTGIDCLHPVNGKHGVEYVSALLTHWLERASDLWRLARSSRRDLLRRPPALPPPLHPANDMLRHVHTHCYAFTHTSQSIAQILMARIEWCSTGGRGASMGGAHHRAAADCWLGAPAQPTLQPQTPQTPQSLQLQPACPTQIGELGGVAVPAAAGSREAARAAAYAEFMAHPPEHWFFCGVSLGAAKRKISSGVVALVPGAVLRARLEGLAPGESTLVLEHLVSYEGMGVARLECVSGCECETQRIDAHRINQMRNVSVFEAHTFSARAPHAAPHTAPHTVPHQHRTHPRRATTPPCEIRLTLLRQTSSGGHKFKVRTLTVTGAIAGAGE